MSFSAPMTASSASFVLLRSSSSLNRRRMSPALTSLPSSVISVMTARVSRRLWISICLSAANSPEAGTVMSKAPRRTTCRSAAPFPSPTDDVERTSSVAVPSTVARLMIATTTTVVPARRFVRALFTVQAPAKNWQTPRTPVICSFGVACLIPPMTYISRRLGPNRAYSAPNLPLSVLVGRQSGRFARWMGTVSAALDVRPGAVRSAGEVCRAFPEDWRRSGTRKLKKLHATTELRRLPHGATSPERTYP